MFEVKLKGLANSGGQRPGSKVQCRSLWRVDSQVPTVTRDFDFMISVFHMKPLKSAYSQVLHLKKSTVKLIWVKGEVWVPLDSKITK